MKSDVEAIRKKYHEEGLKKFSETQVLQLILSYTSVKDIKKTSENLIQEFGCLDAVFNADISQIVNDDINEKNAALIKMISCISLDCILTKGQQFCLNNTENMTCYFKNLYSGATEERLYLISVSKNKMVTGEHLLSIGSTEKVHVDKEKIIQHAIGIKSYGVFISHNHPISSADPSSADFLLTREIVKIMRFYKIKVFDHIVFGSSSIVSMKGLNRGIDFD